MTQPISFGRRLAAAKTPAERLAIEAEEGRRGELRVIDEAIDEIFLKGLAGERFVGLGERHDDETIDLPSLGSAARKVIGDHFDIDAMERCGAPLCQARVRRSAGRF